MSIRVNVRSINQSQTQQGKALPEGGDTLFFAGFEDGDFDYFDGSRGELETKGTNPDIYIVENPVKTGTYAAALQIGKGDSTAAYLLTYVGGTNGSTTIYSADYWVPEGVQPDQENYWWNIWQHKCLLCTKPIFELELLEEGGVLQLSMSHNPSGDTSEPTESMSQTNPVPFPTDEWVNIATVLKVASDTTGYIEVYQNGYMIMEWRDVITRPIDSNVKWFVNSYADAINPNPATIYIDNMKIQESA